MGKLPGAVEVTASEDHKLEIKAAVDAIQKYKDASKLSALLSSCDPKERQQLLEDIQEAFRQRFGREFIRIDRDPKTQKESVVSKEWTASQTDRGSLVKIANKVGEKLERAVLMNPDDRTTKVTIDGLDSWLNNYNEYATTGKLKFIQDYCKEHWGGINVEFTRDKNDHLVASLKKGVSSLPSVPKPIPTALKRDNQKTHAELEQEQNKSLTGKLADAADAVLDEAAELVTVGSEVGEDILEGEFKSATAKVSTYVGKKVEAAVEAVKSVIPEVVKETYTEYVKPTVDAVVNAASDVWKGTTELAQSIGERAGFISVAKPEVETEIDEEAQTVTFKVQVQEKAEPETTVALSNKPALRLPKIPIEFEQKEGEALSKQLSTTKTEVDLEEVQLPAPFLSAKSSDVPSVTLPERPSASIVAAEDYRPTNRSFSSEVTPEVESSLSVLDLPVQKSAYMDLMMSAMKTQLEEEEWEWEEEERPTVQRTPNAIQAVVTSMADAAPVLAAQAAAEKREEQVEQTTRQATAMVAPGVTPTASSIHAAELALVALVDAKAPAFEIERISGLIRNARDRLEKKKAEDEVKDKRVFSV